MIHIEHLNTYRDQKILDDFSMHVKKGSIYGLFGENGSGKTTVLKYLAGLYQDPQVTYLGSPIYENMTIKKKICFIPDELPQKDTLRSLRSLYQDLYPHFSMALYTSLLDMMGLDERKKMRTYSKGMVRQAYFALALATQCDLLLLDEPMDGIDPFMRKKIYETLFDEVAKRSLTIIMSSHHLAELDGFVDTIGIMKQGQMVLEGSLDGLKASLTKVQVAYEQPVDLSSLKILSTQGLGSVKQMMVEGDHEQILEILKTHHPLLLETLPVTLEDLFVTYVGGEDNGNC